MTATATLHAYLHLTQCEERKKNAQYRSAKTYGKVALGLNIANIIYTALATLVIICAVLGSIIAGELVVRTYSACRCMYCGDNVTLYIEVVMACQYLSC